MSQHHELQEAWAQFREVVDQGRAAVESTERFRACARNRTAIYRSLAQVQAMAYNFAIAPSVDHPRIFVNATYQTTLYTLGLACQDFFYGATYLDGRQRYRLTGRIGAAVWSAVQIQTGVMGDPTSRNLGDFMLADFADPNGAFDVQVAAGQDGRSGLPLDPASPYNFLWIRRILRDWNDDHGEIKIEPLAAPVEDEVSEAALARRIRVAADFARFLINNWAIGLYEHFRTLAGGYNNPVYLGGAAVANQDVGSPQAYYGAFVYRLGDDEMLLIEGTLPEASYWGIQLGDPWSNSIDFVNHQADLNMARIAVDEDGMLRAVVARSDPGIANWLDCCGNTEGVGMIRVFGARALPALPRFTVIKRADLDRHLPPGTARVSPQERSLAMAYRRESLRRLYGE
jgi:hypothetical protein